MHWITIVGLAITLLILGPVFTIWALNLVFGLQIPLTIWTWLSVAWLHIVISSRKTESK